MNHLNKTLLVFCLLNLNACMVGPNYKEPQKPVATHWVQKNNHVKESAVKNAEWWRVFRDPTMTKLIHLGYKHNVSLQSAGVRVLQARAQLAQSVGELYPQQQALTGNYTYQRIGGQQFQEILPSTFQSTMLGLSAAWELDFWGKYRREIHASQATFWASYAAYDQALVTLTSDIATTYINIRTTEALIKVIKANIQVQKIGLHISTARYHAGQTSLMDVEESQTQLSQTEALLPQWTAQLQKQRDLLAVLLGTTPDKINPLLKHKHSHIPHAPATAAVGIPRETLAQRPDIYQAKLEAVTQLERIGAVKALLFPALSLTGTFAFASNTIPPNSLGDIFSWSNRVLVGSPSFTWPILNYGQLTNAVRTQDAIYQQALLNYIDKVLKAQQEIQDDITQFIESQKAVYHLSVANRSAIQATKISLIRYKEGQIDYTPVIVVIRQQLSVQMSLVTALGDVPKSLVALYRALGGGWQIRHCDDIVKQQIKQEMAKRSNWGNLLLQQNHQPPLTRKQQLKELYLPNW